MLKQLEIKNYAIIEDLTLEFEAGLNIITGDTGAGKSILLGALSLIFGKRANTEMISADKEKCIVRAIFSDSPKSIKKQFDDFDWDFENEIIIQREINKKGKSRAYINDTPVNLGTLQSISYQLIDIHQQFDQQYIAEDSYQFQLIDAYAANADNVAAYQEIYSAYKSEKNSLSKLEQQKIASLREKDYLTFQLEELENAEIIEDEEIAIENNLSINNNLSLYKSNLQTLTSSLQQHDGSIIEVIRGATSNLEQLDNKPSEISEFLDRIRSSLEELIDLGREADRLSESMEMGNESIEQLTERLNTINHLINKHRVKTTGELLSLSETYKNQLQNFDSLEDQIDDLQASIAVKIESLNKLADLIHSNRTNSGKSFNTEIMKTLTKMDMPEAKFETRILASEHFNKYGKDEIDFLFTANSGTELKPIKHFASGGELSRLNLGIKSLVADKLKLPSMVFDEIDSGISGKVALMMSVLLKKLGNKHQVISITHSPQIASRGNHHLHVYKENTNGKTTTRMEVLDTKERIRNIAIMLSSDPPTKSALKNAEELIDI